MPQCPGKQSAGPPVPHQVWVHHRWDWGQDLALQLHEEEHQGQTPTPELARGTEMECREEKRVLQQQLLIPTALTGTKTEDPKPIIPACAWTDSTSRV